MEKDETPHVAQPSEDDKEGPAAARRSNSPKRQNAPTPEHINGLPDDLRIPKSLKGQNVLRAQFRKGQAEALLRINGELVKICVNLSTQDDRSDDSRALEKDLLARLASNLATVHALSQSHDSLASIKPAPILTDVSDAYPRLHLAYANLKALCQAAAAFERQVVMLDQKKKQASQAIAPVQGSQSSNATSPLATDTAMGPPALPTAQTKMVNTDRRDDTIANPAKRRKTSGASLPPTSSPSRSLQALPDSAPSPAGISNSAHGTNQLPSQPSFPTPAQTQSMPSSDLRAVTNEHRPGGKAPTAHQSAETPQMHPALMHMANTIKAMQHRSLQLEMFMRSQQWAGLPENQKQRLSQEQAQIQASIQNNIAQFRQQYGPPQDQTSSSDLPVNANTPSNSAPAPASAVAASVKQNAKIDSLAAASVTSSGISQAQVLSTGLADLHTNNTQSSIGQHQPAFSSTAAPTSDSSSVDNFGEAPVEDASQEQDDDTAFIDSFLV